MVVDGLVTGVAIDVEARRVRVRREARNVIIASACWCCNDLAEEGKTKR